MRNFWGPHEAIIEFFFPALPSRSMKEGIQTLKEKQKKKEKKFLFDIFLFEKFSY